MKVRRLLIKSTLIITSIITIVVLIKSVLVSEWNTVASSLAVITAIISLFSSLLIVWKQEDDQLPNIYIYFDSKSQNRLTSLKIENQGMSPAYNIFLKWDEPLYDLKGKLVRFTEFEDDYDIDYLPSKSKFSRMVHVTTEIFKNHKPDMPIKFSGEISYSIKSNSNNRITLPFKISLEAIRKSFLHETDQQKFYSENNNLTKTLKDIHSSLEAIESRFRNNTSE